MSYGLEAFNSYGSLMLSSNLHSMRRLAKGSTVTNQYSISPSITINNINGASKHFIAVRGPIGTWATILTVGNTPTSVTFFVRGTSGRSFDYIVYASGPDNGPSADTYGLRVYSPTGVLNYDSGWPACVGVGLLKFTLKSTTNWVRTTHPYSPNYYVTGTTANYEQLAPDGAHFAGTIVAYFTSTYIRLEQYSWMNGSITQPGGTTGSWNQVKTAFIMQEV